MIRVSVFYPNTPGTHFDVNYYVAHHRPLCLSLLAPQIRGFEVDRGICAGPPGTLPAYHAIGHLLFDSAEAFYSVFVAVSATLGEQVIHFTNVEPVVQISEIIHVD